MPEALKPKELSQSINQMIAGNLLRARLASGKPRADAAEAIGVTYQQLEKYEKGINRISAATLILLSKFYDRDLSWFTQASNEIAFENLDQTKLQFLKRVNRTFSDIKCGVRKEKLLNLIQYLIRSELC